MHDAMARILADSSFLITKARVLARAAASQNPHTYLYHFTRVNQTALSRKFGAFHAAEIAYVFGNIAVAPGGYDEQDKHLSELMSAAWVRFATTGRSETEAISQK